MRLVSNPAQFLIVAVIKRFIKLRLVVPEIAKLPRRWHSPDRYRGRARAAVLCVCEAGVRRWRREYEAWRARHIELLRFPRSSVAFYTPENQMQFNTAPSKLNLGLTSGDGGNGALLIAMLYLTDKSLFTVSS